MSHSQFQSKGFILRRAWLSLWDERMTTGRINQVATINGKASPTKRQREAKPMPSLQLQIPTAKPQPPKSTAGSAKQRSKSTSLTVHKDCLWTKEHRTDQANMAAVTIATYHSPLPPNKPTTKIATNQGNLHCSQNTPRVPTNRVNASHPWKGHNPPADVVHCHKTATNSEQAERTKFVRPQQQRCQRIKIYVSPTLLRWWLTPTANNHAIVVVHISNNNHTQNFSVIIANQNFVHNNIYSSHKMTTKLQLRTTRVNCNYLVSGSKFLADPVFGSRPDVTVLILNNFFLYKY